MDETGRGAGRRVAAVGIPALALLGLVLYLTAPARPPVAAPEPPADPEAQTAATAEAAPPSPAAASAPAFDVVRVEPGGSTVVAGTAAPGAEVTIYADAEPLAQATADHEGNFVAIFDAPASAAPQVLTLGATDAAGRAMTSSDTVLLLPPAPPPAPEPAALASTGRSEAGTSVAATTPTVTPEPGPPAVAATAILRADSVEAGPTAAGPVEDRDVTLGSISYAAAGEVALAGLGTAGSLVRTYVDDRLAHEARVGADGRWSADIADVAEGVYTLRIDQLDAMGQVGSRVETPFQRDFPRAPLPRPGAPGSTEAAGAVTVQPGHNLWTLARMHYGSGMYYTQIFTANRALIRDPNLIYPGQLFDLPELDGAE